MLITALGNVI